jgi:hypothetical protein
MPSRALASTLGVLALLSVFGCKPDCRLVCERLEEAECPGDPGDGADCEYGCKHQQDLVTNADCQADFDAVLLCLDSLEDICDSVLEPCNTGERCRDPKCDNELDELNECIQEYCEDHPRNNECEGRAPVTQ